MEALGDPSASQDERRRPDAGRAAAGEGLVAQASLAGIVSQLTGGLVHETRNSLNALAIHLEVLADKLREPGSGRVPSHLEKNLQAARTQIRRLDDTVRRFGEFAAGRTETRDPTRLFSNAGELCAYHLRRMGTDLVLDLPEGVVLRGEPAVLSQLAVEVVLRASSATGGGRVRIDGRSDGDRLVVRIALGDAPVAPSEGLVALVRELGGGIAARGGAKQVWELTLPLARYGRSG
ncbi:MAG TPA: hypothetical protein VN033_13615 [Vulgatibacter sp.]|nr:hypothetical protein [Vulgatibacter sp.]